MTESIDEARKGWLPSMKAMPVMSSPQIARHHRKSAQRPGKRFTSSSLP